MTRLIGAALVAVVLAAPLSAFAQSPGYVTGFPGRDPAGDDEIGWGPAYRPETSFSQPGTPLTPGEIAGGAYRARTGRGPYDAVQAPLTTGALGDAYEPGRPAYAPRPRAVRKAMKRHHRTALRRQRTAE